MTAHRPVAVIIIGIDVQKREEIPFLAFQLQLLEFFLFFQRQHAGVLLRIGIELLQRRQNDLAQLIARRPETGQVVDRIRGGGARRNRSIQTIRLLGRNRPATQNRGQRDQTRNSFRHTIHFLFVRTLISFLRLSGNPSRTKNPGHIRCPVSSALRRTYCPNRPASPPAITRSARPEP